VARRVLAGVRVPAASDTRLLAAGVTSIAALVVYLAVAFANTHASNAAAIASKVAPWTPYVSKLMPVPLGKGHGYAVRVTRAGGGPSYGAVVQTLVPDPKPGGQYIVGLWLKGARPGQIGIELNEFRPGLSRYPVKRMVPATRKWHHFTFSVHVRGTWLGLATYVYRVEKKPGTWFEIRGLTASLD
jgi:hypothetical protein